MTETKCTLACNFCRVKKIKCSGEHPCGNCLDHDIGCVFPPPHIRTRNKLRETNKNLRDRISRLEARLEASKSPHGPRPANTIEQSPSPLPTSRENILVPNSSVTFDDPQSTFICPTTPETTAPIPAIDVANVGPQLKFVNTTIYPAPNTPPMSHRDPVTVNLGQEYGQSQPSPNPPTETNPEGDMVSPSLNNWEYHGPISYLSIGSSSAAKWLSEQIGDSATAASAGQLSLSVTRAMKLDRPISPIREPEPNAETAWSYTTAYFEGCLGCIFGVIHRKKFEARLRATWSGKQNDDFAWYALRNTVYAAGCKILLSRDRHPNSFGNAQDLAWRYFENALSMHTDLLYVRSDLTAIEALVAMAFHTEGFGNPALEYMLMSNALRLAQSKGLHRQPLDAWNMSEEEILERNWLFWVIYAYEKHIAFRSGRPSAIDDEEISCHLPTKVVEGSTMNAEFFTEVIKHARITSGISRGLNSFRASQQPPEAIIKEANKLETQLRAWREALPPYFKHVPASSGPAFTGTHPHHIIYLDFAYYGSLIAIHSRFVYPWNRTGPPGADRWKAYQKDIAASTEIVVESSRQIILATKRFDPQGSYPTWLTFFYPILGLINIFVQVLRSPTQPSTMSDLALVDVAAGHFSYLEFLTNSRMSFPYIKEIASLARVVSKRARERQSSQVTRESSLPPRISPSGTTSKDMDVNDSLDSETVQDVDSFSSQDFSSMIDLDLGLENWPNFVPSLSMVSDMAMSSFQQDDYVL